MKPVDLAIIGRPPDACEFCVFPGFTSGIAVAKCKHPENVGQASGIPMAEAECCMKTDWKYCPFNEKAR